MIEKKQLVIKAGTPYPFGVKKVNDTLSFSVEIEEPGECGIYLYKENEKVKVPFAKENRYGDIFCGVIEGVEEYDSYQFYQKGEEFLDSYAKSVIGNETWGIFEKKGAKKNLRGILNEEEFAWKEDKPLRIPYENSIFYLLHVRGFTNQKNSKVKAKGTFQGIIEKIPYLKKLGVTTLELMPCYEFLEAEREEVKPSLAYIAEHYKDNKDNEDTKINYWGYKKGYYFAPKTSYSHSENPVTEFKKMVQKLHENGIELIMQFYFPDEIKQGFILEVLRYWILEYHIDGIHLLGAKIPTTLLATDSILKNCKLMYYQFDLDEIYQTKVPRFRNLASYRDDFMFICRQYLKSDDEMLLKFMDGMTGNSLKEGNIHYLTNYYGFTLQDLVSYDKKHNEDNGEENRDGTDYNYSWNCGAEGATRKKIVTELRRKQIRNAFVFLLLSQGTPLILSGDEFGNSQDGNNNAYCQDNEIGWVSWNKEKTNERLLTFVKELIAFRKEHPIFYPAKGFQNMDTLGCGYPDLSFHGEEAWRPNTDNYNRHIGMMYCGKYAKQFAKEDSFFYVAYNMHWVPHSFALPKLPKGKKWHLILDTEQETGFVPEKVLDDQQEALVKERSIQIFVGMKEKTEQ